MRLIIFFVIGCSLSLQAMDNAAKPNWFMAFENQIIALNSLVDNSIDRLDAKIDAFAVLLEQVKAKVNQLEDQQKKDRDNWTTHEHLYDIMNPNYVPGRPLWVTKTTGQPIVKK